MWILSHAHAILCDFLDLESYGDVYSSHEHDKTHGNTKEKSVVSSLSGPSHLGHGTFTRVEYEIYLVPSSAACTWDEIALRRYRWQSARHGLE
jgi:hypothetical protein